MLEKKIIVAIFVMFRQAVNCEEEQSLLQREASEEVEEREELYLMELPEREAEYESQLAEWRAFRKMRVRREGGGREGGEKEGGREGGRGEKEGGREREGGREGGRERERERERKGGGAVETECKSERGIRGEGGAVSDGLGREGEREGGRERGKERGRKMVKEQRERRR